MRRDLPKHWLGAVIALCALGYFAIEVAYFRRLPLVMDELDGAYDVYRLRDQIPYRDFTPYKTVLAYYVELPAILFGRDVWSGVMAVKTWLAMINAGCMALCAWLASRLFARTAVALALPCWMLMTTWLERSSELRVDTLTAWPGVLSLLLLMSGRAVLAGCLAALAFLCSQKGAYYLVASAPALLLPLALPERRREALRDALRFGTACGLTLAPYFALFSALSTPQKTATTTFLSHNAIAFTEIYPNIRRFWRMTLIWNPGFYGLALIGLFALLVRGVRSLAARASSDEALRDLRLLGYGAALTACGIWHKQPWPYFFVMLIPTGFVLCIAAIELCAPWRAEGLAQRSSASTALHGVLIGLPLVLALATPIARMPIILRASNGYQRNMIELASALVQKDEHYLACMDFLYDREQPSSRVSRFSILKRKQLEKAKPEVIQALLHDIQTKPPKLLIRTERFNGLPPIVRKHLKDNYAPFWGSIELYAPRVTSSRTLELAFAGPYRVAIEGRGESATIDGEPVADDATLELSRGPHAIEARRPLRLLLQAPQVNELLKPRTKARQELFPFPYDR